MLTSDRLVQKVLDGKEQIVSTPGTSQYGYRGGVSACGLVCLNLARVIFQREQEHNVDILKVVMEKETAEEAISICAEWTSSLHLEVDEIYDIPIFEKSLRLVSTSYDRPGVEQFKELLRELRAIRASCVAIITRPPEIIACFKLVTPGGDVFVIFDSHPRPSHPEGAGFIFNTSMDTTAIRLSKILHVDDSLLVNGGLQWQAQLLSHYSGHIFISKGKDFTNPTDSLQTIVEASLSILEIKAEIADLKYQNSLLESDNKRLESEMEEMEDKFREERENLIRLSKSSTRPANRRIVDASNIAGSSRGPFPPSVSWDSSVSLHDDKPWLNSSILKGDAKLANNYVNDATGGGSTLQDVFLDESITIAAQKQRQYDEEDTSLRAQRDELARCSQRRFECGICLEELPEDSVARIDPCSHSFCRECVRNYIGSKLEEHRFPIVCPICTTMKGEPSVITDALIHQIGVTDEQYKIWDELLMVQFSIIIHCRKCKQSVFVYRQDVEDTKTIACPLPGCNYIWCKACQQAIEIGGPQHSCDGSSELDHLMKSSGWKYCPNCKTPCSKEVGCNHMTCISPGCNTHFCYLCGGAMVRSALQSEIKAGLSAHYLICQLMDDIPDRAVPP